ncbi:MAG: hypothetical protein IJQ18_03840 [Paludibacteraceae bacterium]|nr:hypothetical protein [Paludibacteraceae bacterium]
MVRYPDLYTEAVKPDIIAETEEASYMGWFSRGSEFNRSLPPEEQPICRIRRVTETVEDGSTVTRTQYPDGKDEYIFVWNDRESLTYKYRQA